MKKFYVGALLCTGLLSVQAQQFAWAVRGGSWAYDYGYGIANDHDGNVYVAGKYEENAEFGPFTLPCQGNHDIFVTKYNATGDVQWVASGGGPLGDYAHAMSCDGNYLYVAGEIEGTNATIVFPGSPITLTSISDNDIFVTKYDLNGSLLWARSAGGWRSEKALAVSTDNSGNVIIAGYYEDSCTFNGSTLITGRGLQDIFLAKYDPNGNFMWVKTAGGPGRDEPKQILCDANGNIYMCGFFSPGASFGSQAVNAPNGYYETFVTKYDANGNLSWVTTGGGDYDDVAWGMAMDKNGNLVVSGEFNASAFFGSTQLITSGNADIYVASYDGTGNTLWAKRAGGPLIDRARGLGCDGNNIYITGQFGASASFGNNTLNAADSSDIFFAALDNGGNFISALSATGVADSLETLGYESGIAICADPVGNVYATGSMLNGAVFGSTSLEPYKRTDVFVTRISQMTGIEGHSLAGQPLRLYPNPTSGELVFEPGELTGRAVETHIFNNVGELIASSKSGSMNRTRIDLSDRPSGIYFVEIKSPGKETYREKVVLSK
jgi:hypothetical protein